MKRIIEKMHPLRIGTKVINALAHRAGYGLVRLGAEDLTGVTNNPVEALYRSQGRPCIVNVPVAQLRGSGGFAFAEGNPFVDTLIAYGTGECREFRGSPLDAFYREWQPRTLAESLGLDPTGPGEFLSNAAGYCKVRPWQTGFQREYFAERLTRKEFRKVRNSEGIASQSVSGTLMFGPVSLSFGEITFRRLAKVFDSISANGYRPAPNGEPMRGTVLVRDGAWRLVVHSGKHRAAACTAAACTTVPIMLEPLVVRRDDVASWPNVRAGLFTREQACSVFDRWFDGRHPWLERRYGALLTAANRVP